MAAEEKHIPEIENLNTAEQSDALKQLPPEVTEVIESLSDRQRKIIIQSIQAKKSESFRGPIPHPELLQGYENVKQGFAERIVTMAEEQQKHRIDCQNKMIDGTISDSKRGQWMAFIIAVLFLIGAVILGLFGHDTLAGVIGGGTLITLVTIFITGRKSKQEEERKN